MERLAAHPDVGGYGEVLLHEVEGWSNWPPGAKDRPFYTTYMKDRGISTRLQRHTHLWRYLDYIYEPRRQFRAIGFKLMYDQVARYPEVLAYIARRRIRVLHLIRTNLIDLFLSREALSVRRFAHARSEAERETVHVHVDTSTLLAKLARLERERRVARLVLAALPIEVCELQYEALLSDDAPLYAALAFLGVTHTSGVRLPGIMLKLARSSHCDGISNVSEVRHRLEGTRFSRFLRLE
jgi:hypothetical protein